MSTPKTTLGPAPWPARPRKAPKVYETINVDQITLVDDALPTSKTKTTTSKYHGILSSALDTGKAIKTPPGAASAISNIARTWLRRQGHSASVHSVGNHGDGHGRVWLVKTPDSASAGTNSNNKRIRKS